METKDPIGELALERFGVRYLYPYQRLVVANVLDAIGAGERLDQLVILPTGAGKSLCFQLPAALCPGLTVVVFPLLGLMADQARRLSATGIGLALLKGGQSAEERTGALAALRSGAAKLAIANPEILEAPDVRRLLSEVEVSHLVIDEAHCVAEWGDSFRPAYLGLGRSIASAKPLVVTAFTATASPPVLARVAELLFEERDYGLVTGMPDRPNIRYEVRPCLSMRRALRQAVREARRPAIVFAPSRSGVEILAEDLRSSIPGLDCRFYHAGLEKAERAELETWFMASKEGLLLATCAYGMGMDKPDVRTVIHYGPPASVEAYLQESGRAGRDGQASAALLLAWPPSSAEARFSRATPGALAEARAALMEAYAGGGYGCRRAFLLRALGYAEADTVACSGCDACDGREEGQAPGEREILAAARAHPRRMTALELGAYLRGAPGAPIGPWSGALGPWLADEAEEAVKTAVARGLLRSIKSRPWKGRLYAARAHSVRKDIL